RHLKPRCHIPLRQAGVVSSAPQLPAKGRVFGSVNRLPHRSHHRSECLCFQDRYTHHETTRSGSQMAEPHSVVVYVADGSVQRIAFCECCPPLLVEVRTYRHATPRAAVRKARPRLPKALGDGLWRDHEGIYEAEYHESPSHHSGL